MPRRKKGQAALSDCQTLGPRVYVSWSKRRISSAECTDLAAPITVVISFGKLEATPSSETTGGPPGQNITMDPIRSTEIRASHNLGSLQGRSTQKDFNFFLVGWNCDYADVARVLVVVSDSPEVRLGFFGNDREEGAHSGPRYSRRLTLAEALDVHFETHGKYPARSPLSRATSRIDRLLASSLSLLKLRAAWCRRAGRQCRLFP
jgi:hypothetical protein